MNIKDCIEKAAKELPEGAIVYIAVEKDSAWIEATDSEGEKFDVDQGDMNFEEHLLAAVEWCKEVDL